MTTLFKHPLRISKTPLRVGFFGGGTDYSEYFERERGAVLGTSINLYINIIALPLNDFCEQKYRLMYSRPESVNNINDIKHPVMRNILLLEKYEEPLNIAVMSDVPSGTGLGSSSTFTVGMYQLIYSLLNKEISKVNLAKKSIFLEQKILKENVGIQDQIHASFGGLSLYEFYKNEFVIKPIQMHSECYDFLSNSMYLIYTKISRRATNAAKEQINNTKSKRIDSKLNQMKSFVYEGKKILEKSSPEEMLKDLGELLNESWHIKRNLSSTITDDYIDQIHEKTISLGAYGGKLCGAGGGGFFFVLAPKEIYSDLIETFGIGNVLSISIDNEGAQMLLA